MPKHTPRSGLRPRDPSLRYFREGSYVHYPGTGPMAKKKDLTPPKGTPGIREAMHQAGACNCLRTRPLQWSLTCGRRVRRDCYAEEQEVEEDAHATKTHEAAERCRQLLGGLMWMSSTCRLDTAQAVYRAARHMAHPTRAVMGAAQRVLLYLVRTASLGLTYGGSPVAEGVLQAMHKAVGRDRQSSQGHGGEREESLRKGLQALSDASRTTTRAEGLFEEVHGGTSLSLAHYRPPWHVP